MRVIGTRFFMREHDLNVNVAVKMREPVLAPDCRVQGAVQRVVKWR